MRVDDLRNEPESEYRSTFPAQQYSSGSAYTETLADDKPCTLVFISSNAISRSDLMFQRGRNIASPDMMGPETY